MTENAEPIEDRLADFTRDKRILLLSVMAIVIGAISAVVAKALVWLIAVITNLTFTNASLPTSFLRQIITSEYS